MKLEEKEYLVRNPFKYNGGEKVVIEGGRFILDHADACGNSAPFGNLFARRDLTPKTHLLNGIDNDIFMDFYPVSEPMGEVVYLVDRFSGKPIDFLHGQEPSIQVTPGQVTRLYNEMFPRPTTFWKKIKWLFFVEEE